MLRVLLRDSTNLPIPHQLPTDTVMHDNNNNKAHRH